MQGCGPDSGSWVPRFSHRPCLYFTFHHVFSLHSPLPTPGQRSTFSQSSRQQYDNIVSLSASFILHIPNLQQSAKSVCISTIRSFYTKSSLYLWSGPTPHSSDFRQGFGSQLGDYAPGLAICLVPPVGFHQSRAMEDCALTASGSKRTGLSAARVAGLGDKKIRRRHASRFLVFTSHLSSLDLPLALLPCIALIVLIKTRIAAPTTKL